jgi:tetratricopeptide (TPR) repeat protein
MSSRILIVATLLLAAISGGRVHAQAESAAVDEARSHFKLGIDSYNDGDLTTALIEFKRAYEAAPNYRLLYNLGQVARELRDYPEAERYFRAYLRDGADDIDRARRDEVETELAKVTARITSLVLSVNVPSAELFVDDVSVGHAPLADVVRVSAGRHRISANSEGHARVIEVVDAAPGDTMVVELKFAPPKPAAPPSQVQPHPSTLQAASSSHTAVVLLGVGTGALAVGTGVMAYLAAHDAANYRSALDRKTDRAELDSLKDSATTKALVTDILLGTTVVMGVTTLIVAVMGDSGERAPQPTAAGAQLAIGAGSVGVNGAF